MAYIHGIEPGLVPTTLAPAEPEQPVAKESADPRCAACDGLLFGKDLKAAIEEEEDELVCRHCQRFFGINVFFGGHGQTNYSIEQTKEKLAKALDGNDWAMMLITRTFAGPGGVTFTVEKGDFFKIIRVGAPSWLGQLPCRDRSSKYFSIDVKVGTIPLTLFPHEFSPHSMGYLLTLVADKEMEVKYISQDDDTGYYTPTPEVREQIRAMFGD